MKSFSFQRPWISTVRGLSYLILGIIAIVQKPNSFQPLLLIMALLFGFIVMLTVGETLIMKKEKLKGTILAVFIIHLFILLILLRGFFFYEWGKYSIEEARFAGITAVLISIGFNVVLNIFESIALYRSNCRFGAIYLIEGILSILLMVFFASLFQDFTKSNITMIGYFAVGFGVVSILINQLVVNIRTLSIEQE